VPTTVEGLVYALLGMLVLMAIYHLGIKYPIARVRARRGADRNAASPAAAD